TPHQGIHTNNYVEAWHKILKTYYLNVQDSRHRIDEVIQILADRVQTAYLITHIQVAEGIKRQRTNKFQDMAKAKADKYTPAIMQLLGIEVRQTPTH
ncbi:hypothetical protein PTTG_10411, partial [Puccinia triticina 1-1 BBBD Race 1]|uniref:Uncharacterized protein n=1 Tax=Puccinia triticina (isolate 1-1 / race 1 (BBBD)) TaxID=630390 RepID=A0A0C4FB18_PUCT1